MPNTKPVGVAFSDPELTAGTTITGALIDSTSKIASNIANGFSTSIQGATIATTGNSDAYVIAQAAGTITSAIFSGVDALTANDTNFITFSITNLGQAGSGSAALLAANTARSLTLNGTAANLVVASGDRLRIRAAASGTLANTVTFPTYRLNFTVA